MKTIHSKFCPKLSADSLVPTPHPAHRLTGCLKFYYWFPLPRASLTGEGRETDPLHLFIHQAASLRSPPLIRNPGAGLSVPFPRWPGNPRIRITYSRCSRAR